MQENQVKGIVDNTLDRLKNILNTECVVGKSIETDIGKIIPICKASVGFVSGGGEYNGNKCKLKEYPFAGGSSAGVSLTPIGFLIVKDKIQFIKVDNQNAFDKLCDMASNICEEIKGK